MIPRSCRPTRCSACASRAGHRWWPRNAVRGRSRVEWRHGTGQQRARGGSPEGQPAGGTRRRPALVRGADLPPRLQITHPSGPRTRWTNAAGLADAAAGYWWPACPGCSTPPVRPISAATWICPSRLPPTTISPLVLGYPRPPRRSSITFAAVRPAVLVYCRNSAGELLGIGHATFAGHLRGRRPSRRRHRAAAVGSLLPSRHSWRSGRWISRHPTGTRSCSRTTPPPWFRGPRVRRRITGTSTGGRRT